METTYVRSQERGGQINRLLHESGSNELSTRLIASRKLIEIRDELYPRELRSLIADAWWLNDNEFSLLKTTLKEKEPTWIDSDPDNHC